ncbi:MAG: methyltransferase domain-containing protein [Rhodospirillales bacterium]|nr:methyltransferase domain-containing protein [Rhodospirillales bacterium]
MATDPLARAKKLAERGAVGAALRAAQKALNAAPDYWQALNFMGAVLWRQGHRVEALAMMEKAIKVAPDTPDIQAELIEQLFNASLKESVDPDRAVRIVENFIDRHRPTAPFLGRFVSMLLSSGRFADGLRMADRAVALFPDDAVLHQNRSAALIHMGRAEEAVAAYARGVRPFRPEDEAKGARSLSGARSQYADLAPSYDANPLHQSFSERMAALVTKVTGVTAGKRVLDAGCGSGLLGTRIKAGRLVGIDFSPDMLAAARARGVYDELFEGDLVEAMAAWDDRFDIIVSACVLYHLANLAPFFRQAARLLVPGGHLFLSVDPAPDEMDIGVTGPGEFAHSRAYLRRLAAESGFAEVVIKIMPHRSYPGFWCAFRRLA